MTYHIQLKQYNCPKCNASYIPYEKDFPCPSCKEIPKDVPEECLGFIDGLITSLYVNKMREGRYVPSAWYSGTFSENLQKVFFRVFYVWSETKPKNDELWIEEYFKNFELGKEDEYLRDYLKNITLKIYSRKDEISVSWWTRLKSRMHFFGRF